MSDDRPTLTFEFTEREQDWGLAIGDLLPGLDRATVYTENGGDRVPSPVHDLFEVVKV